jgi:beta-xylosidase
MKNLIILLFFAISFASLYADNTYTNPVLHPDNYPDVSSAADPFVFKDTDGTYYCYVTGGGFPVFSSKDLVNWTYRGKAFPKARAKWATINFWAPEVVKIGNIYYLNYTGSATEDAPKRIGLAKSKSPVGPFDDVSSEPFYNLGTKGCIDSHIFTDDDGRTFLYYSLALRQNVVNGINRSEIWVVELNPDLSGVKSAAKQLFYPTHAWESNVNEAPVMVKRNGIYYLMYSGNGYGNANYAVGYATASSPTGPFTKYVGNPILIHTGLGNKVTGTGHNSVTVSPDGSELICVYHSHINLAELGGGPRKVNIDRMGFTADNVMYIDGPTITSQLYPSSSHTSICPPKEKETFPLFPNPAKEEITVIIPDSEAGNIEICDLNGRIMYSCTFPCDTNKMIVPVVSLNAGTYIICLKTNGLTQKGIFIKA